MSTTTTTMTPSADGTMTTSMGKTTVSTPSIQLGGRRHYKRGRKHRKGGDITPDIEMGPMVEEETITDLEIGAPMDESPVTEDFDYTKLEEGTMSKYNPDAEEKVGGTRRRKNRKSRKTRKVKRKLVKGKRRSSRSSRQKK